MPAGLSLNGVTGIISGTPTSAGNYTIYVHAIGEDPGGNQYISAPVRYTINIGSSGTTPGTSTPSGGGGGGGGGGPLVASVSPSKTDFVLERGTDIVVTLSPAGYALRSLQNGSYVLVRDKDYAVSGNTITIKADYLNTLGEGSHSIAFNMSGGGNPVCTITVVGDDGQGAEGAPGAANTGDTRARPSGSTASAQMLAIEPIETGVKLAWTPTREVIGYRLYRSETPGGEAVLVSKNIITGNAFIDANVDKSATYYYTLREVLAVGEPIARLSPQATVGPGGPGGPGGPDGPGGTDGADGTEGPDGPDGLGGLDGLEGYETLGEAMEFEIVVTLDELLGEWIEGMEKNFILMEIDNEYMSVNGARQEIDPGRGTVPVLSSSRTLMPIRAVIESMGGTVGWDGAAREITLDAGGNSVTMWLNSTDMIVNGEQKEMDVAPITINDRTMVPLRFAAENVGCVVEWLNKTSEIVVVFYTAVDM